MTFGMFTHVERINKEGVFLYYRNRLIKSYMKFGIHRQSNSVGKNITGIVEMDGDFLTVTHNKQDFDQSTKNWMKFKVCHPTMVTNNNSIESCRIEANGVQGINT